MARIVNSRLVASNTQPITTQERRRAERRLERRAAKNPLRVVRLACHGPVRDVSAVVGDWIWCNPCADLARVVSVRE